jgi:hypothetical protein
MREQLLAALKRHPAAAADVAQIFRAASLRAAAEMGVSQPQLISGD